MSEAGLFDTTRPINAGSPALEVADPAASSRAFQGLFDHSRDGVIITTPHGVIVDANPAALMLLGYAREALKGVCVSDIYADIFAWERMLEHVQTERAVPPALQLFRRKDGTTVDCEVSCHAILKDAGQMESVVSIIYRSEDRTQLEGELRRIFDASPDMICVTDSRTGQFKKLNPAWTKILGYTVDELMECPFLEFVHPDDREATLAEIQLQLDGGKTLCFQNRYWHKDGSYRWFEWQSTPVDEWGLLYAVARDITKRKNQEKQIQYQAQLLESVHQAVIGTDVNGIITYWNAAAETLYGWPRAEALGRNIQETTVPHVHADAAKEIMEQLSQGREWSGEFKVQRRDGTIFPAQVWDSPVMDDDGRLAGIIGVSVDISKRKKAEKERDESNEIFRCFMEYSPIYVIFKDENIRSLRLSKNYERMLGKPIEELLGKDMNDLFPSELAKRMVADDKRILHEGKEITVEEELNGRFYSTIKFPIISEGKPRYLAGYTIDITERKQLEAQQAELHAQLLQAQKMESVGQLASGIAHDFNNLLSVILANAHFIQQAVPPESTVAQDAAIILEESRRAARLVEQLLTFSRRQVSRPVILDVSEHLKHAESMLRSIIPEHINVTIRTAPAPCTIRFDANQLDQVLMNLVTNAIDAMPDGGSLDIAVDRTASTSPWGMLQDTSVTLEVADSGCGMSDDVLAHIFEPFFTTKDVGKGTGLGLATVYGIMVQNGAYLQVESKVAAGSKFRLYFPVVEGVESIAAPAPALEAQGTGDSMILLVEDNHAMRLVLKRMLTVFGYGVLEAENGQQAIELFRRQGGSIDLLLTDVVMPGMKGMELAGRLREIMPLLKVLYMSGYGNQYLVPMLQDQPGTLFIRKPFTAAELIKTIRRMLTT